MIYDLNRSIIIPYDWCPSVLQVVLASISVQWLSQIAPQTPLKQTSTLPSYCVDPSVSLISPVLQSSLRTSGTINEKNAKVLKMATTTSFSNYFSINCLNILWLTLTYYWCIIIDSTGVIIQSIMRTIPNRLFISSTIQVIYVWIPSCFHKSTSQCWSSYRNQKCPLVHLVHTLHTIRRVS